MPSKPESTKKKEPVAATPQPTAAPTAIDERWSSIPQMLRGMKDVLPDVQPYWMCILRLAEEFAQTYGYARIDTPLLEPVPLFERAIGATTGVVAEELYAFADAGGERVALRPEATAGIARAYIEHGMANWPQPVKLFSWGPMFRYERPQAGRLRQFHQCAFTILGEQHPAADAELMLIGANVFRAIAMPVTVQVNSVGCAQCRPRYLEELSGYLTANRTQLSEASRGHLADAPLRVLASAPAEDREILAGAPQLVDWLCDVCKQHFIRVLEYLDELEVPYGLSPFLVRDAEYHTKTVFEFLPASADGEALPQATAVGGGGRFDALMERLGGHPTPSVGIAFGIERIVSAMRDAVNVGRSLPPPSYRPNIFLAQLGEQAKRKAMRLFEDLRKEQFLVAAQFSKDALKAQLELAVRLEVALTLILGQKEVIDGTIIIREMSSGIQEIVAYEKVVPEIRKRLEQEVVRRTTEAVVTEGGGETVDTSSAVTPARPPRVPEPTAGYEEGLEEPEEPVAETADEHGEEAEANGDAGPSSSVAGGEESNRDREEGETEDRPRRTWWG